MKTEILEKLRLRWHKNPEVLHQIIDRLKYRETVFIRSKVAHRCLKINKTDYFWLNANRYHFFEEDFNLYNSLAHYPDIPMFSFNIHSKKRETEQFNQDYQDHIKGFDFMLDIDNPDIALAYSSAFKVKEIFDAYKVPYWLMFSGTKGFHFRVDYVDFPQEIKNMTFISIGKLFKQFAERLKFVENIPDIDLSVFDLRRVAKTPYSVVYPYYLIAKPLNDEEFGNFYIKDCSLPVMLQENNIKDLRNNGVKKRAGDPKGFLKLIDDYMEGIDYE